MSSHDGEDASSAKPADTENGVVESTIHRQNPIEDVVPMDIGSSPPDVIDSNAPEDVSLPADDLVEDDSARADSEAETVVLTGADGSPQKKRRSIKHEDQGDREKLEDVAEESKDHATLETEESIGSERKERWRDTGSGKRKRGPYDTLKDVVHGGTQSSGLSSVSSSPAAVARSPKYQNSDSNPPRSSPSQAPSTEKSDKQPRKRKHTEEATAADDGSHRKSRQRPNSEASSGVSRDRRDTRSATHGPNQRNSDDRSPSPHSRSHRRAISTQSTLPQPSNGHTHKKKKIPPPLNTIRSKKSSDRSHSDSDSASGDAHSHPHLRKLTSTDISIMSPAKMPHKKHRDQIGRTFLARACANMEVEGAQTRLSERPEDIDVADNAGNTPLQIASLEGSAELVRILIEAGCDVHCKNNEKDTPLIDAVENGHLEVVQLLLDAGANPRQGNLNGVEPEDLLSSEDDNFEAIKHALSVAKNRTDHRRQSEDHHTNTALPAKDAGRSSRGASAASPRESPPMAVPRSPPAGNPPRRRTVRSEATRNDLLWMRPTPENLRDRAGKGDMAGVGHVLNQVPKADTESLIAAARGGHDEVIQLLLGMGEADADPSPLHSPAFKPGYNTPMLAAIGRGNEKVLQLLLTQPKFDPTRRLYKGLTYYDIAKERQNFNWEKEYEVLKEAYDKYVVKGNKTRNGPSSKVATSSSAPQKHQNKEKQAKSQARTISSSSTDMATDKKALESPGPSGHEANLASQKRDTTPKETKRDKNDRPSKLTHSPKSNVHHPHQGKESPDVLSDSELTPLGPPKRQSSISKRRKSDASAVVSEGEVVKPRRKLVSGKVLRTDKEKKRRDSIKSSASASSNKDRAISLEPVAAENSDNQKPLKPASVNKSKDEKAVVSRLKASASDSDIPGDGSLSNKKIGRENSHDRLNAVREDAGLKRARSSVSPQRSRSRDMDTSVLHVDAAKKKRRRIVPDSEATPKPTLDHKPTPGPARVANMDRSAETATTTSGSIPQPAASNEPRSTTTEHRKKAKRLSSEANAIQRELSKGAQESHKKEQVSTNLSERDAEADASIKALLQKQKQARKKEEEARKRAKEEFERRLQEEKDHQEQVLREQAEEQARLARQAEEERRAADKAERERQAQAEKEEYERKERIAREEEEVRLEQKRKADEAERQVMIARQEEEARIEKKRREEELQRRRMEQERVRREEQERRRAEREELERQQRIQRQEEEERQRRLLLPNSLRRAAELDVTDARTAMEARKWLPLYSVPTNQLDPNCDGETAHERWITNFQAAPILGIKDLQLSQYTAWEKRPLTDHQRTRIWRVTRRILSEAIKPTPLSSIPCKTLMEMDVDTEAKFLAMEHVFWIKLSDFMDIVPRYPHLQGLPLRVREAHVDYVDRLSGGVPSHRPLSLPLPNGLGNGVTTDSLVTNGTLSQTLAEPIDASPTNSNGLRTL